MTVSRQAVEEDEDARPPSCIQAVEYPLLAVPCFLGLIALPCFWIDRGFSPALRASQLLLLNSPSQSAGAAELEAGRRGGWTEGELVGWLCWSAPPSRGGIRWYVLPHDRLSAHLRLCGVASRPRQGQHEQLAVDTADEPRPTCQRPDWPPPPPIPHGYGRGSTDCGGMAGDSADLHALAGKCCRC